MKLSLYAVSLAQVACIFAAPRKCRAPGAISAQASAAPSVQLPQPSAPAAPAQSSAAPAKPSAAQPAPSAVVSVPAIPSVAASSAAPSNAPSKPATPPSSGSLVSGGKPIIDSVNEYRKRANLPLFTWDSKLAANAQKTCADNGGKTMNHELNPGSWGQTMAPGFDDGDKCKKDIKNWTPFEIFFYAWMCELSTDPALGGICPQIWEISGIPSDGKGGGHHDILASTDYKTIGCAFARDPQAKACDAWPGIWTCDVGF